ncbi:hypothetical protein [Streptomyces melanogenes]|uniref:hypothetical protein n=1 Tax=Streptomyces melanogenes TaxID=67326 RepID=UPI00167ECE73|nr:hypothetical protein [Streptomyces melanogenes]GGP85883.1 hypothetical protein GCM10010278_75400 [Streptomyces melanogenes]
MVRRHTAGGLERRRVVTDAASGVPDPSPADPKEPANPALYRHCEVCREPGADIATRIFVADSGASHTSYAHRGCAEATEPTGVITP